MNQLLPPPRTYLMDMRFVTWNVGSLCRSGPMKKIEKFRRFR